MKIDNIIISSNDSLDYIEFLPIISKAWKKLIPSTKLIMGYVSSNSTPNWMKQYAEITHLWNKNIPSANYSKISRLILATQYPGYNMLSDIDMLPLQANYFLKCSKSLQEGKIIFLSSDAYNQDNRFPICYIIAHQNTYKEIINPNNLNIHDLLESWIGYKLDKKDDINKSPFSDESLLRWLLKKWNHPERMILFKRGWIHNIAVNRIDRTSWNINHNKLQEGLYIDAHMLRPLHDYKNQIRFLTNYLGIKI